MTLELPRPLLSRLSRDVAEGRAFGALLTANEYRKSAPGVVAALAVRAAPALAAHARNPEVRSVIGKVVSGSRACDLGDDERLVVLALVRSERAACGRTHGGPGEPPRPVDYRARTPGRRPAVRGAVGSERRRAVNGARYA